MQNTVMMVMMMAVVIIWCLLCDGGGEDYVGDRDDYGDGGTCDGDDGGGDGDLSHLFLIRARNCAECFMYIILFDSHNISIKQEVVLFSMSKTKAQRGQETLSRPQLSLWYYIRDRLLLGQHAAYWNPNRQDTRETPADSLTAVLVVRKKKCAFFQFVYPQEV